MPYRLLDAVAKAARSFVSIGFDQHGRAIEMTGRKKPFGVLIFHANTPPTTRALKELGLGGDGHGRGH